MIHRAAVFVMLGAGALGCGSSSTGLSTEIGGSDDGGAFPGRGPAATDGGSAPSPATTLEAGCAELARLCDRIEACAPFFLALTWGDVRTCTDRTRAACLGDTAAPGSGLTPAALSQCARAVAAASCEDLFNNRVSACQIKGTLPAGTSCGTGSQCQTAYCKRSGECGVCAARATAGGACNENDDCDLGLVCGKGKVCAMPAETGAACDDRRPCRAPLVCAAGLCAAAGKAGDPCSGEDTCSPWQGVVCNTQAKVCQTFHAAAAGESCGLVANALCAANGDCRPNLLAGVCQAAAKEGEACGPMAQNRKCLAPAWCANGLCKLPSASACR